LIHWQEDATPAFPKRKSWPHRLDFGTSVSLVVGLNAESTKHLNKPGFSAYRFKKRYVALLDGWVDDDQRADICRHSERESAFSRVKYALHRERGYKQITQY